MYSWKECRKELKHQDVGCITRFFICASVAFDAWLRKTDFKMLRSYGGRLEKWMGIDGHSPLAMTLSVLLLYFVVFGPTAHVWSTAGWIVFLAASAGIVGSFYIAEKIGKQFLLLIQVIWFTAVCAVVWLLAGGQQQEAAGRLYEHFLTVALPILVIPGLFFSWLLNKSIVGAVPDQYREIFSSRFPKTELFQGGSYPISSGWDIVRCLVNAPLRHPLMLLYWPSLIVVLLPHYLHLWLWFWISLAVSLLVLCLASIHRRFEGFLLLFRRIYFIGGQWAVSVLIIVFAISRLAGVTYVTTILDSSASINLFLLLHSAYAFFWFYEYWINRFFCEGLLSLLKKPGDKVGQIPYDIELPPEKHTRVPAEGRVLQIHGGARFAVVRDPEKEGDIPFFHVYERGELFEQLGKNVSADAVADIKNRIRFYFTISNLIILVIIAGFAFFQHTRVQNPIAVFSEKADTEVDLQKLLFHSGRKQAVLVAASGGGTRAAMYTASALRGIQELGALEDVVLASGVSGGSASLAYFAGHYKGLVEGDNAVWRDYARVVRQPFIRDVLEGIAEWRIVGGTRLGKLLEESFRHNFDDGGKSLDDIRNVGLIFNTALAGRLCLSQAQCPDPSDFPHCAQEYKRFTTSDLAGGRLIFTNLVLAGTFPHLSEKRMEEGMPYIVVRNGTVKLSETAALSANFPPVFSYAAVDDREALCRYWVTDGGAVENRGILSLLLATREAVYREVQSRNIGENSESRYLPELHIVMIDASAGGTGFAQDRGIGSTFGAKEKLGTQLMAELVDEIGTLFQEMGGSPDSVTLHNLAMPRTLRIDGGLGTHWMLPTRVVLRDPNEPDPDQRKEEEVGIAAATKAIFELHRTTPGSESWYDLDEDPDLDADFAKVRRFIDPQHKEAWNRLKSVLGKKE